MLVRQLLSMKSAMGKPGIEAQTVVTISPDLKLAEAGRVLAEYRIGAVVVSSDGVHPEGILSERDIVHQLGTRGTAVLDEPVRSIMSAPVETCDPGDDALDVLERMTAGRFRHMPVVDAEGRMLGFISIGDAVSGRLKELAAEKEALTGMIMGA
ncbi:MAG: CBS domain-containing protein [Paracoccus sp. (in: a-proteobacteria)]|nr:CBS domain-containing protein [Paracoccus sp. (in: a-proteobacteria)]